MAPDPHYERHLVHHRELVVERRTRLRAEGRCIDCGSAPATVGPRGGRDMCDACREKHRQATYRSARRRKTRAALEAIAREYTT